MARILVTGASGFLGTALCEALGRRGDEVLALDLAVGVPLRRVAADWPRVRPVVGDLLEWPALADLLRDQSPDAVLHCAAVVGVIASVGSPLRTMQVNVEGTLHLLECMRRSSTRRLLQVSTEEVYGAFTAPVADEEHPRNPVQAYGISKLACEQLARTYASVHGLECVNLRTSWVYGPGLPRDRVPRNLLAAAAAGRSCHLAGGGDAAIDHTYLDDFVSGTLAALDHRGAHRFDAYHVASGRAVTVREIVEAVRELVPGADVSAEPGPYLHGPGVPAVRKGALDVSRAAAELGWRPAHDIRSGLRRWLEVMRRTPEDPRQPGSERAAPEEPHR